MKNSIDFNILKKLLTLSEDWLIIKGNEVNRTEVSRVIELFFKEKSVILQVLFKDLIFLRFTDNGYNQPYRN